MGESQLEEIEFSYVDGWHVAVSLRHDIASQGNTAQEAQYNLLEALALHIDFPRSTDRVSAGPPGMGSPTGTEEITFTKLTFRQIRFKLENAGFTEVRQLGNHAKFVRRDEGVIATAVMPHYIEISSAVLASIVRQSGLEARYFWEQL